jgi:indolepyruvate ferredoxin oxidoreductase
MSLHRLMSYKDEYEVARLYSDAEFQRSLSEQFEGEFTLEFHMAPPLLARPKNGEPPSKMRFGPWLLPALRWLARGRVLRGTAFDPFGRTEERRIERELIGAFESRVNELLPQLAPKSMALATLIAQVPMSIRGFGHVKLGNLVLARTREAELLHRLDAARYPAPARPNAPATAGQLRGIPVVTR